MTRAAITKIGIIIAIEVVAAGDNEEVVVAAEAACKTVGSNEGMIVAVGTKVDGRKEGIDVEIVGDAVITVG